MRLTSLMPALLGFALLGVPSSGHAQNYCRGKPSFALSDGSRPCELATEVIDLTYSQGVVGAGAAASRKSVQDLAVVYLYFPKESSASNLSATVLGARASEVCKRYQQDFLSKMKRPRTPFMAVVSSWGKGPTQTKGMGVSSPNTALVHQQFLNKRCRIRRKP